MSVPSIFDSAVFNGMLFYPSPDRSPVPAGARDAMVPVAPGVRLHLRVHERPRTRASCLLFHGNGEVVADYDEAVEAYAAAGLSLAVADYRGYGRSEGQPTLRAAIQDARLVFDAFRALVPEGPVVVMGRSLGGVCAAALSAEALPGVVGFIFESAAADLLGIAQRRGFPSVLIQDEDRAFFDPLGKARQCTLPALVLHGAEDSLILPREAQMLYQSLGSAEKTLVWVPGRGHNDLSFGPIYWEAMRAFVARVTGAQPGSW